MSQKAAVAGLSSQELPKSSCPSQNSTIASQVLSDAWLADLASSSRWMHGDSAVGFRILCHKIRVYESGILRALRFNVGPLDLPFSALRLQLKAFLTRCSHAPSIHPTPPTTPTTTTATPVSSSSLSAHSIKQTSDGHLTDLCYHSSPSHKTPYHTPTSSSPSSSSSSSSTSRTGSSCCPTEESGRVQRRSRESSPSADAQQPGQGSERSRPVAVGEGTKGVKKKTNTDTRKISEPTSSVKKENDHQGTNQKKRNSTSDCGTDSSGTAESPPSVRVTRSKSRGAMKGSSSSVGAVTTEVARSSDGSGGMTKKAVEDANEKKCREEVDTKEVKPGIGLEGKETKGLDHTVSSPSTPKTSGDTKVISKAEPPSVGSASSQGTEEIKKRGVTDSGGVQTDKEGEVEDFKSKAFCPVDFHPCCCESWPASGVAFAQLQDQLHSAALRELSLLFRTPFILERDTNAVVAACVIRAAIACGLPLAYSPPPPPPPAFSNTDRRDQGTHQPGDGTSTKTATPSPCGPSASGIRCINPEPVTEDLSKKSSARKDETHGRSFDAADEELRNPDKAIEMNERRVRSRVKTPTGEKGRERFLQALEAFDMHVERFLKGLKNPFWTRKTTVMRGGGSQDANTSKAARHEEDMDSDLTRGSQVFGVDPVEVQAALSELRLATIWMDDLLHTRGPLLLPSPVLTQPQTCRSVKRRDVFSSAHDDEKRRRVKFEMKITKTEEVGVAEELEEGAEERMVTSA
ncbi:hypothetical protein CSUI_007758 [Cystoisospora suis]|uniref:Uncharacterized protein n=1 Tax=Cystoisospora suis TaxID=483139 RepID=A0A2C6KP69_9APIC|nr:hypothetical protein CSUI_007758 [Cystoisospora suis]